MEDIRAEEVGHVFVDIAQDLVDVWVDRIELAARWFDAVVLPWFLVHAKRQLSQSVALTPFPAAADVSWSVELGHHFDAAHHGVAHDLCHVLWPVHLSVVKSSLVCLQLFKLKQ